MYVCIIYMFIYRYLCGCVKFPVNLYECLSISNNNNPNNPGYQASSLYFIWDLQNNYQFLKSFYIKIPIPHPSKSHQNNSNYERERREEYEMLIEKEGNCIEVSFCPNNPNNVYYDVNYPYILIITYPSMSVFVDVTTLKVTTLITLITLVALITLGMSIYIYIHIHV